MKTKSIITGAFIGAIAATAVYAEGENIVTSKTYVDSGISQKQGIISKASNNNSAMLFPTATGGTPQARTIQTSLGTGTDLVTRGAINTALNGKQETVNGVSGSASKVVLYNASGGLSGTNNPAKGVYDDTAAYNGNNLVEAQHVNGAVATGFNAHLTCAECGGLPLNQCTTSNCNLWQINTLNATTNTYVPHGN